MSEVIEWRDGPVPCFDPECVDPTGARSVAEPDGDNELRYYTCETCGSEFGFQRVPENAIVPDGEGGSCSIGVPEAVRRRASVPMERALASGPKPIPLQISFGPPAE